MVTTQVLQTIIDSPELLEVARKAIEDELVDMRDNRMSMALRNNGLVIRESDGSLSNIIRFGPEGAMLIGLEAIIKHIEENANMLDNLNDKS